MLFVSIFKIITRDTRCHDYK